MRSEFLEVGVVSKSGLKAEAPGREHREADPGSSDHCQARPHLGLTRRPAAASAGSWVPGCELQAQSSSQNSEKIKTRPLPKHSPFRHCH